MKRFLTLFLSVLLIGCLSLSVFAEDGLTIQITGMESDAAYVVDNANILSDSEEADLNRLAAEISQRQQCDVLILTENSIGTSTPDAYAESCYEAYGCGYGEERSGILFLLSMAQRDWCLYRQGETARQAISFNETDYLWSKCGADISGGNYFSGFRTYLNTADTMLSAYHGTLDEASRKAYQDGLETFLIGSENPSPVRTVRERPGIVKTTIIALIVGFLLAFLFSGSLRSQLKSVRMKYNAASYRRPDSMHLEVNRDIYLYANTTSRVIETQRTGGNGGSPHVTTSTVTHDSTSGKF